MTDQPRDLAAEVEEIRRQAEMHIMSGFSVPTLLEHIAALCRELEEHRKALRWALENGVAQSYESETGFGSHGGEICIEPPAHLAPILAEAMRSKP